MSKDKRTFAERFPLHQQMKDNRVEHETLSDFFAWADAHGVVTFTDAEVNQIMADYFGVDLVAFEAEKRDMIEMIKEYNLLPE